MKRNIELKKAIIESGKTQFEISQEAGLCESRLSQIVTLRVSPMQSEKEALSEILGKSKDELFITG